MNKKGKQLLSITEIKEKNITGWDFLEAIYSLFEIKRFIYGLYGIGSKVITPDGDGSLLCLHGRALDVALKSITMSQVLHGTSKGNPGLDRIYLFKDFDCPLQLRSLSSITDDEAIEVAKIAYEFVDENCIFSCVHNPDNIHDDIKSVEIQTFINLPPIPKYYKCCHIQIDLVDYDINLYRFTNDGKESKDDIIGSEQQIFVYQYLQQKGFALPIYFKGVQYSVEVLIEKGLIVIIK